jgi:drug/metabolite transporter (DMT)-like permease
LIKIASRAFDPLGFAPARVGVAAAAMLLTSALSGKVWAGSRRGLWAKLFALALIGQVIPFLLLGKAATLTTSADIPREYWGYRAYWCCLDHCMDHSNRASNLLLR